MPKSYGQIAFEAYIASKSVPYLQHVIWDDLVQQKPDHVRAWEAVGEAVRLAIESQQ